MLVWFVSRLSCFKIVHVFQLLQLECLLCRSHLFDLIDMPELGRIDSSMGTLGLPSRGILFQTPGLNICTLIFHSRDEIIQGQLACHNFPLNVFTCISTFVWTPKYSKLQDICLGILHPASNTVSIYVPTSSDSKVKSSSTEHRSCLNIYATPVLLSECKVVHVVVRWGHEDTKNILSSLSLSLI